MRTHCSYAPSSGGAVERQNQTSKNKLAKCCEESGLTWLKALPIVLMYMRMRKRVKTNLSPFEILFGRPPFMGMEGGKQRLPSTDVCENDMLNYCKEMSCLLSNISVQVKAGEGRREGYVGSRKHCRRVPPIAEAEQSLEEVQRECQ